MNQSDLSNSSIRLLANLYRWRKQLLIVSLIAAVVSSVIALLLSPQYKATAIVFPSRSFSVSKLLIEQNMGAQEDYMELGDDDDAEKLLQMLNSSDIRVWVADKFDLWKHWRIEKDNKYALHYLKLKWEDMVCFKRTNFLSVRVEVYDYEANRAADIANSIIDFADSVKYAMNKEIAGKALKIVKEEYDNTTLRIKELEDSLQKIKELGVLDYKSEITAYTKSMARAIEKGNDAAVNKLQQKLDVLKKYGVAFDDLAGNLKKYRLKYPLIKFKYDEALVNYNSVIPSKFVVEKATPNEKKERPMRWLIVLVSVVSAFLLAYIYLVLADKLPEIKKKVKDQLRTQQNSN